MTALLAGLAPPLFAGIETGAEYMVKVEIDWDAEHEVNGAFEYGMHFTPVDVGMSKQRAVRTHGSFRGIYPPQRRRANGGYEE